jgi:hypothetical protein
MSGYNYRQLKPILPLIPDVWPISGPDPLNPPFKYRADIAGNYFLGLKTRIIRLMNRKGH